MVRVIGFEPIRPRGREILSLLRLPISPYSHIYAQIFSCYATQRILRQSAHETRIFTKVKNPIKQDVFALKQGKKCPRSDCFRLYRSFRNLLSSHFFPKLFTQNGRAIPVRTTLARRKNPPRRYTLISNTHQKKIFPLSRSLPQEPFQKKCEEVGKRIKFPVPADVLIP